jgi:hypothetical protein
MDKAQYINLQQKIKAGTATPEEIQAVKEYEASMEKKPEQPWFEDPNSTVAEDKIAEIEQKKRMENPIEGTSGDIARGNQGDNVIENPNALNTAEVTDVHQHTITTIVALETHCFPPNVAQITLVNIIKEWQYRAQLSFAFCIHILTSHK